MRPIITTLLFGAMAFAQAPTAAKAPPPAATKVGTPAPAATKTGTAAPATKAAPVAPKAPAGPNLMNPASLNLRAPEVFQVRVKTTKGDFVIETTRSWAPNGADHFYNLVRAGYFTDASFFRVIPNFMVQFGISARPEVSRIWAERKIPDDPVTQSNTRGMVTFAQTGQRNSRSTQLFINFADNSRLDKPETCQCPQGFMPFGKVIEGMDVVDSLYSGYGGTPSDEHQNTIVNEGKAFVDRTYPRLDRILTAAVVPAAAPPAGDAKAAAPPTAPKAAVPAAAPKAADTKK